MIQKKDYPIYILFAGVLVFFAFFTFLSYRTFHKEDKIRNAGSPLLLHILNFNDSKYHREARNFLSARIGNLLKKKEIGEKNIIDDFKNLSFVEVINIQHHWLKPNLLELKILEPVAQIFLGEGREENLFGLSNNGRIMTSLFHDLPVISAGYKITRDQDYIKNKRLLSWLDFLDKAKKQKGITIFNFISELKLLKYFTALKCIGIRTRIFLPVLPQNQLILKLDTVFKFLVSKSIMPQELDLRGENAVFRN
jgi:hypothetical protein